MAYTDFNVPDGVVTNMTAGQPVVFGETLNDFELPGERPTTCIGFLKNYKLTVEGATLIFKQGMPLRVVNQIVSEENGTMTWEGFEWDLEYFQLLKGNEAVDDDTPDHFFWGVGGRADQQHAKFCIFHKLLNGRYIYIDVWNAVGNGSIELTFPDDDWFKVPYTFNLHQGVQDFSGKDLTKDFYFRIDETNFQTP